MHEGEEIEIESSYEDDREGVMPRSEVLWMRASISRYFRGVYDWNVWNKDRELQIEREKKGNGKNE